MTYGSQNRIYQKAIISRMSMWTNYGGSGIDNHSNCQLLVNNWRTAEDVTLSSIATAQLCLDRSSVTAHFNRRSAVWFIISRPSFHSAVLFFFFSLFFFYLSIFFRFFFSKMFCCCFSPVHKWRHWRCRHSPNFSSLRYSSLVIMALLSTFYTSI